MDSRPLRRDTREEIAKRYAEWEIVGEAEIRDVDSRTRRYFTPHTSTLATLHCAGTTGDRPSLHPAIDAAEAFLLRSVVTAVRYLLCKARQVRGDERWRRGCTLKSCRAT
jgi:hypothetical protein